MNALQKIIDVHNNGFQRRKQWPVLFDLDKWKNSEEYALIKEYTAPMDIILEIGCLTGHHLINLSRDGYQYLRGIDFCQEAVDWAREHDVESKVDFICKVFPDDFDCVLSCIETVILFDVLEHVPSPGLFLTKIEHLINPKRLLVLVPLGLHYRDEGHLNFYPDCAALQNLLQYYFTVEECRLVCNNTKIFALCRRSV